MSGDELVTLVGRVWQAWSETDYETMRQLVAPDVRWSDGEGFDVPWRTVLGWEPLRELVETIHAGGQSRRRVVDAVVRDDKVAAMTFHGARQHWADHIGFDYFRFADGRIVERTGGARSVMLARLRLWSDEADGLLVARDFSDPRLIHQHHGGELMGATLTYARWRHTDEPDEHCGFCWANFDDSESPDHRRGGYLAIVPSVKHPTHKIRIWICEECFDSYRYLFDWKAPEPPIEGGLRDS